MTAGEYVEMVRKEEKRREKRKRGSWITWG
jgi:hypothetical protein